MPLDPDYDLFAEVIAAGSLSAAARAMRLSPAMVSKRLARLEARLGVRLVHRTTRHLSPTPAGERFHADVLAVLAAARAAEDRVAGVRTGVVGALSVSAPTSFGRLHVAPLLARFAAAHPAVALRLDLTDRYVDLAAERVDLGIRIAAAPPAGLAHHRLAASPRLLAASPGYLARAGVPGRIGDLAAHRLLAADGQLPWRLVDGPRRRTVAGQSHVRTNSSEVVRELAVAGAGIALRSLWDVGEELRDGRLVPVLPAWTGPSDLAIYAVHLPGPGQPAAVEALVAFLRDAFDPSPWS